jgi:hypothetical protein
MPNTKGFRNATAALAHWSDHRDKFKMRPADPASYEAMADAFFGALPPGVAEGTRLGNKDRIRFDPATSLYGLLEISTGIIRTFFPADPAVHRAGSNADYFVKNLMETR